MKTGLIFAGLILVAGQAMAEKPIQLGKAASKTSDGKVHTVAVITDRELGRTICKGGVVPESGLSIMIKAKLTEIAGQRFNVFLTSVQNGDNQEAGTVVIDGQVFRAGEISWVDRTGWEVCD